MAHSTLKWKGFLHQFKQAQAAATAGTLTTTTTEQLWSSLNVQGNVPFAVCKKLVMDAQVGCQLPTVHLQLYACGKANMIFAE